MDTPEVFGLKLEKTISAMAHNIMGETVRPRRTSGWALYNRQKLKISNSFDSPQSNFRNVKLETGTQSYNTGTKQNVAVSNTINLAKTFTEYCDKCSLHGLKYVGDLQLHPLERIFWAVAFMLAVATAAYFITLLYRKWDESPVIVSVGAKATQLISIPFPAVTICNMNKARRSIAKEILNSKNPEDKWNKQMLKEVCESSSEMYDSNNTFIDDTDNRNENWDTVQTFMTKVRQSCFEMIKSCYYGGHRESCEDIFNPSLTDEGICCSFNKVKRDLIFRNPRDLSDLNVTFPIQNTDWTPEGGYPPDSTARTIPWRPRGAGSHLGLTIVLDANLDDYYCSSTASTGFKLRLHNPVETPKVAEFGLLLSPGEEYRVAIKPTISNASFSIRKIPENKRQCVFSNEKYLKFYRTYTQRNCALECEANYTLAMCMCVPYYLPKDANTTICAKKDENCTRNARWTIEISLVDESANTSDFETGSQKEWPLKRCQCLPGCSEIRYRGILSSGTMSGNFSLDTKDYVTNNATYFRKNMAVVHLFFTESRFMNYYKSELFGFTEFLSNTGGLLGLFLGFSFLSAVEAIYFITIRLWCSINQRNQNVAKSQKSLLVTNSNHVSIVNPYPFAQ